MNAEKGKRYLAQLDQALCNGNWVEVPELARKTDKHASERKCFTFTARTEAQIASASRRPTSASSHDTASIHSLSEAIPKLQEVISASSSGPEEAYCARTCLAEIHWMQEDGSAVLKSLPGSDPSLEGASNHGAPLGWLEVCVARASFLRAAASEAGGLETEARAVYRKAASQAPGSRTPELRRWTERLLAKAGVYASKAQSQPTLANLNEALAIFRAWASFWQRAAPPVSARGSSRTEVPRRQVWRAYYDLLSCILQHGLLYNPSTAPNVQPLVVSWTQVADERYIDAKVRQRAELKRVEATYESLLLNETQFPKASETNTEVEEWVEQAIGNWKILCGGGWIDAELGEGGKGAVGRSILDILYRAATKTFHSTAILRQLFTVHAAVGEFELAMHAFNSYVEIVGKGKARAVKTGKHELGFDNDDSAMCTAAEAVRVLCKYGDRDEAEKALHVAETIRQWLGQQHQPSEDEPETSEDSKVPSPEPPQHVPGHRLQRSSLAVAHRAIGISHAHWARLTYEDDKRSSIYLEAAAHLKKSLAFDDKHVDTAYELARVLAETQDVTSAMDILRRSIALSQAADDAYTDANSFVTGDTNGNSGHQGAELEEEEEGEDWERQRRLMPLWHLLSLCLTAKDDYEPAIEALEAAYEQFGDSSILWGRWGIKAGITPASQTKAFGGLVDQMDSFEKESFLEMKMTQITFLELTEGIEKAVESSNELLACYTRLFGSPQQFKTPLKAAPTAPTLVTPPSRAGGGTLRSLAGSIRPRSRRTSADGTLRSASYSQGSPVPPKRGEEAANGGPVAITVTNEDGVSLEKQQQHHHHHHLHIPFRGRGHHGEAGSLRSQKSTEELNEKSGQLPSPPKDAQSVTEPDHSAANPPAVESAISQPAFAETPATPLKEVEHNAPHNAWPAPTGHADQPLQQDLRLPAPHPGASKSTPTTHFTSVQERQHKISVLVGIWIYISGLYMRAGSFEDASGAVEEAGTLVEVLEGDVMDGAKGNARKLFWRGWGGGKSVDGLWGDVFASRGDLAIAKELPFQAMSAYEAALSHWPDHSEAIIGLSNLLMDIYEQKLSAEEPQPLLSPLTTSSSSLINPTPGSNSRPATTAKSTLANTGRELPPSFTRNGDPTPEELNRLAARDRAYMLLHNLTRLGTGWDDSEAWVGLARAYELKGDTGKAKGCLWWVVELEDSRPIRGWA